MKKTTARSKKAPAKTSPKTPASKSAPKTMPLTPIWAALVVLALVLGAKYAYLSTRQPAALNASSTQTSVSPAGNYSAVLPAASSPGRIITLQLSADGQASLHEDYQDNQPVIMETGVWDQTPDGRIKTIFASQTITFTLDDKTLTATEYDLNLWGSNGLILTRV